MDKTWETQRTRDCNRHGSWTGYDYPASGFVGPLGALFIGLSAGIVCYFATQFIKRKLKIDDSLDVFPVHGVGGILGTLLAGVFVAEKFGGVGYAEGVSMAQQMGVQGDWRPGDGTVVRSGDLRAAENHRNVC